MPKSCSTSSSETDLQEPEESASDLLEPLNQRIKDIEQFKLLVQSHKDFDQVEVDFLDALIEDIREEQRQVLAKMEKKAELRNLLNQIGRQLQTRSNLIHEFEKNSALFKNEPRLVEFLAKRQASMMTYFHAVYQMWKDK